MFLSVEYCLNNNVIPWTWFWLNWIILFDIEWKSSSGFFDLLHVLTFLSATFFRQKDTVWNSSFSKNWLNYLSNDIKYYSIYIVSTESHFSTGLLFVQENILLIIMTGTIFQQVACWKKLDMPRNFKQTCQVSRFWLEYHGVTVKIQNTLGELTS